MMYGLTALKRSFAYGGLIWFGMIVWAIPGNANAAIDVVISPNKRTFAINEQIYGVNFADWNAASTKVYTLNRWGGDWTSRYHWQYNIANHAEDWYFENIPNQTSGSTPTSFDSFVTQSHAYGMRVLGTIPILGWLPKNDSFSCSYPTSQYGSQQQEDSSHGCGNGVKSSGSKLSVSNLNDVATFYDSSLQAAWISHIKQTFGPSSNHQGVDIYSLDNEPVWWYAVHQDIHPQPATYSEQLTLGLEYAKVIKQADPTASVSGPVAAGWQSYFYSAADMFAGWAKNGDYWSNPTDRLAHGNQPFLNWYLSQMASNSTNQRLLDYLDIHAYVSPGNVSSNDSDAATQALRVESTAVLWDSNYRCSGCSSFLDGNATTQNQVLSLIPRMHTIISQTYPQTKLAISEYTWGGYNDISGAIAQADILGIFGVYGVDAATGWIDTTESSTAYWAFKMFRNYDGNGSQFLSQGVDSQSSNPQAVAVYSAMDANASAMTVMVINKTTSSKTVNLKLQNFSPATGIRVYQYSGKNLAAIVKLSTLLSPSTKNDVSTVTLVAPAYSISLLPMQANVVAR